MQILVCGDHPLFLDALAHRLRSDGHDVAACASVSAALVLSASDEPDVCVLDLHVPGSALDGPDLVTALHPCPVVLVTGDPASQGARRAVQAGVRGLLSKDRPVAELLRALHRVAAGERLVEPELLRVPDPPPGLARLTAREREVLALLVEGHSTAEVARRTGTSVNTARHHVQRILQALHVGSRLGAVAVAVAAEQHAAGRRRQRATVG